MTAIFSAGLKCRERPCPPAVPEGVRQVLNLVLTLSLLGLVEVCKDDVQLLQEQSSWCEYEGVIRVSCDNNLVL